MTTDSLLSRLEKVKRTGHGRWIARCPAHDDRGPSLSIRQLDDGRVLVHCFAGCSVHEVISSVGLEMTDLFPTRDFGPAHVGRREGRPFPATDVLQAVGFEVMLVALIAGRMVEGEVPSPEDRDRLYLAHQRLQAAIEAGGLAHE
jgi:hypothetical protein